MPNAINFALPPRLQGEAEAQLGQMHNWLFQLTEQLNVALGAVEAASSAGIVLNNGSGEGGSSEEARELAEKINEQRDRLKALIIKTADIVRFEYTEEIKRLESSYLAVSDFGEYREEISREIRDTAEGTVQSYAAEIGLESYIADSAALKEWQAETSGYIKQGFIYRNAEDVPVLGIAIGQNIQTEATLEDGTQQISLGNMNLAFYTSEGLEFYVNGIRVAFFRNDAAEMNNATITGRLRLGNWEFSHTNGLQIKWIGGD